MMVKQLCAVGLSSAPAEPWASAPLSQQGPGDTAKSPSLPLAEAEQMHSEHGPDLLWDAALVGQLLHAHPFLPAQHTITLPPLGWLFPSAFCWAVASCPAKVVACSQHSCWGHTPLCCHRLLEGCKCGTASCAGQLLLAPRPSMFMGCWTVVGSTALYPSGGPGRRMGVMVPSFSDFMWWATQFSCKCIRENEGTPVL